MIYLDSAATSHPKNEPALRRALDRYLALGASPGRGGYDRAVEAEGEVAAVRRKAAEFFNAPEGSRVCFAANATGALNLIIQGMAAPGVHVVSTRLEHNSVLRPLNHMSRQGMQVDLTDFDSDGYVHSGDILKKLRPETKAVVMTHASNVLGTVQPVSEVGGALKDSGVRLCVDVAQTAGIVPLDMQAANVSAVAFTGHKSLGGPAGIGGLVLAPDFDLRPSLFGGTGVDSANGFQPDEYPAHLEAGTRNMFGILALGECLQALSSEKQEEHLRRELGLLRRLREGFEAMDRVTIYGVRDLERQVPVLSCNIEGMAASDVGAVLDGDFDIAVRTGLHCAPLVHESLGTFPRGTVRFSLGQYSSEEDVDAAIQAFEEIIQEL